LPPTISKVSSEFGMIASMDSVAIAMALLLCTMAPASDRMRTL